MLKSTFTGPYETLRELLVEMRTEAGLTQRALAKKLGVPHSWVAKIELGERRLDLIEFLWICDACGANGLKIVEQLLSAIRRRGHTRA